MADCLELERRFQPLRVDRVAEGRGPYVDGATGIGLYELDPDGRLPLGLSPDDKICDGAAYDQEARTLCFFELKSKWSAEADQQLASAIRGWKSQDCPQVRLRAVLIMSGSAPRQHQQLVKQFRTRHKVELLILKRSGRNRGVRCTELFDRATPG